MAEWGNLGKAFVGVGVCVVLVGLLLLVADRVADEPFTDADDNVGIHYVVD